MEKANLRYVMRIPGVTKDAFLRECYLDLAKKTSSAEAISHIRLSDPIEMATVTIKHDVMFDVNYSIDLGHKRVEQSVVEETHRAGNYTYTEEVTKKVHHIDWEHHTGKEAGVKTTYFVPLKEIDHSPFWIQGRKPKKQYWEEQGWNTLDPTHWSPASPEIMEKLTEVYFDENVCTETAIKESGIAIDILDKLSKDTWENFQKEYTVLNTATTIGVNVEFRTQGEYRGQKFHIPRIANEILPIPTQRKLPKVTPQVAPPIAPASPNSVEANREELLQNSPEYVRSKSMHQTLPFVMVGGGLLGLILSILFGSFMFLLMGIAVVALALLADKKAMSNCSQIEEKILAKAQEIHDREFVEYQKANVEYQVACEEYKKACKSAAEDTERLIKQYDEEINQQKIEALNALFSKLGMVSLSDQEKAQFK